MWPKGTSLFLGVDVEIENKRKNLKKNFKLIALKAWLLTLFVYIIIKTTKKYGHRLSFFTMNALFIYRNGY
mgnify:CR=1 FL=1